MSIHNSLGLRLIHHQLTVYLLLILIYGLTLQILRMLNLLLEQIRLIHILNLEAERDSIQLNHYWAPQRTTPFGQTEMRSAL